MSGFADVENAGVRPVPPPPAGWRELAAELDAWSAAGRRATFWWRDDDAVAPTPALERLLALRAEVPITLAVIPARARHDLADLVAGAPAVTVAQHGFAHVNHAPGREKKAELGGERPPAEVLAELARGRERLASLFGDRFLPLLAPPWNRIDAALMAALPGVGIYGVSAYGVRGAAEPAPGLRQANCHVDIVAWRRRRGFVGESEALAGAVGHLRARRLGRLAGDEPTGLLTHHLAHDAACWEFLRKVLARTRAHPAVRWIEAREALWPAK